MVRQTTTTDDESTTTEPATFFDKVVALEDGDRIDLLGESLKVSGTHTTAASKIVYVIGAHEDPKQIDAPRYELVADARYDDVDVCSTARTDSHEN